MPAYVRRRPANELDLEDVASDPAPGVLVPEQIAFTADDKRIGFLIVPPGASEQRFFSCDIDPAEGSISPPVHFVAPDFSFSTEATQAFEAHMRYERPRTYATGIYSFAFGPVHSAAIIQANGSLYVSHGPGSEPKVLLDAQTPIPGLAGGPVLQPKLSPDECVLAFVRGGEMHVISLRGVPSVMGGDAAGSEAAAPAAPDTRAVGAEVDTHARLGEQQMGAFPLGMPVQCTHGSSFQQGIWHGTVPASYPALRRASGQQEETLDYGTCYPVQQVTTGANGTTVHHGLADHCAKNDLNRSEGFWWSDDSRWIAFQETDESSIPEFLIARHVGPTEKQYDSCRYPFAGGNNAIVKIGVVGADCSGPPQTVWLDLGIDWVRRPPLSADALERLHGTGFDEMDADEMAVLSSTPSTTSIDYGASGYKRFADGYVASVQWGQSGALYVVVQDRSQRILRLLRFVPPGDSWRAPYPDAPPLLGTIVIEEQSPCWISLQTCLHELAHGDLIYGSAQSGFFHLYRYSPTGACVAALTSGRYVVDSLEALDEAANRAYLMCSLPDDSERNLYAVPLFASPPATAPGAAPLPDEPLLLQTPAIEEPSAQPVRITHDSGWHEVAISHSMSTFVDVHSSMTKPFKVLLCRLPDGQPLSTVFANEDPRVALFGLRPPELVELKSAKGDKLRAAIYHPPAHFPRPRPLIVSCYGGAGIQFVSNTWNITAAMQEQHFAQAGYVVMRLDSRGSARRGTAFEQAVHGQFGKVEVADQIAGVKHLIEGGLVDSARVGVIGWSYGGYLALLCLEHAPDVFTAACSGAPVTLWTAYDTHYTERHLGLPEENVQGYLRSSALTCVDRLRSDARLMLIHGLLDNNVHFRNSALLIDALNKHGKAYELLVFPQEQHRAAKKRNDRIFLEDRIFDFFESALNRAAAAAAMDES